MGRLGVRALGVGASFEGESPAGYLPFTRGLVTISCARLLAAIPSWNVTIFFPVLGVEGVAPLAFFTGIGVPTKPAPPLGAELAVAPFEILMVFGVPPLGVPASMDCFLFAPPPSVSLIPDLGVAALPAAAIPRPLVEMLSGGRAGGGIGTGTWSRMPARSSSVLAMLCRRASSFLRCFNIALTALERGPLYFKPSPSRDS